MTVASQLLLMQSSQPMQQSQQQKLLVMLKESLEQVMLIRIQHPALLRMELRQCQWSRITASSRSLGLSRI
jgi:hypothetical protein